MFIINPERKQKGNKQYKHTRKIVTIIMINEILMIQHIIQIVEENNNGTS